jgi:nucleotidyltransferase substrate binding protein (TIGR01987 family)
MERIMSKKEIRWKQRLSNYKKALDLLSKLIERGSLDLFEEIALIKSFELSYELAWNVIKDFYQEQGSDTLSIQGSKDAFKWAFKMGLIQNGHTWMKMVESRNLTTHTYNEELAKDISTAIIEKYYPELIQLKERLDQLSE